VSKAAIVPPGSAGNGTGKTTRISANQFNVRDGYANSANLYLEHFPYIDRLWFGEYFDYDEPPAYWLVEMSGIPFGLMGEMLQDGGNPWRGMLFGMTSRLPWAGDPTSIWKVWDDFQMHKAEMYGFWAPSCPIKTDHPDVLATAYVRPKEVLIAVGSWAKEDVRVRLEVGWAALGLDPAPRRPYHPAYLPGRWSVRRSTMQAPALLLLVVIPLTSALSTANVVSFWPHKARHTPGSKGRSAR
jgi:hypothetical protein